MADIFYSLPSVILLGIFMGLLYKANRNSPLKDYFFIGLLAKFSAGIGLLIIYFKYYEVGDIISYYKDSVLLADYAFQNPGDFIRSIFFNQHDAEVYSRLINQETSPRALLFVKIVTIIMIITGKNFWITSLYFSLFSFIGFFSLSNQIVLRFEKAKFAVIIALLFFPSMLFWTSGVVKEALSAGCITLLISYLFIFTQKKVAFKWYHFLFSILFVWVLWEIKYYIAAIFLPLAISFLFVQWYYGKREYSPLGLLLFGSILVGFVVLITFTSFNLHVENLPGVIYKNYTAFHRISEVQDVMSFPSLDGSWTSVIYSAPWALVSGLFR
ncbi:MAG: hypothetical protein OEY34_00030, partial [Cyclobacteriaceae bacterium]|nr:hypothetical protein [Cyclobacteriaceae bacterium]